MAVKSKTSRKSSRKPKTSIIQESYIESSEENRFNQSKILQNKKILLGLLIAAALLIALLFLFRGLFIAAIVNREPITRISVIKDLEKQSGQKTLENLITKKLILQEAKKRKLTIEQNEIEAQLKKISVNLESQGTTLDQALQTQGMTRNQLNEELKIQLLIEKMVEKSITVSEKEIADFLTANKDQQPPGTPEELRKQAAEQIRQQKQQEATQKLIGDLQKKAKIINFVKY